MYEAAHFPMWQRVLMGGPQMEFYLADPSAVTRVHLASRYYSHSSKRANAATPSRCQAVSDISYSDHSLQQESISIDKQSFVSRRSFFPYCTSRLLGTFRNCSSRGAATGTPRRALGPRAMINWPGPLLTAMTVLLLLAKCCKLCALTVNLM